MRANSLRYVDCQQWPANSIKTLENILKFLCVLSLEKNTGD